MTHIEIEPWAAKTLMLLKSPSDDAAEELRNMLVEAINQKYNGRKQFKPIPPITGHETEKIKSKDSKSLSSSEHKQKSSSGGFSPSVTISPDSYASDSDSSSRHSEMVILEEEYSCTVCREGVHAQWNQLIECAECHSVYHQQCHNPPVPDTDASDPRVVWNCRNCTKTLSKPKTSQSSSSSNSKSSSTNKTSGRSNTSSPSFGSKPFGGVSVSSKKSSNKSSHSNSSKSHTPNINIISADKRLQIMKKKAARKQEKRPK